MPKPWPQEDVEYLEDRWGSVSIPEIAKNLNRSVNGVKLKAQRMGLGRHIHSGDYFTVNQLFKALSKSYSYTIDQWLKQGLPVKKKKVVNNSFLVIYVADFWKWAEKHKMLINFSKVERNILGPEPNWVADKRKADIMASRYKTTPWTQEEDMLLKQMLNAYRYSYRDISIKLGRTEGALKRRMKDLDIKQRPLKADNHNPWTQEEETVLVDLWYKGYIAEAMAEKIPRSALAINGKIERMVKDGALDPSRYRKDSNSKIDRSGVSYKEALPENAWKKTEHFLGCLSTYSKKAKENGVKLDLNIFLDQYSDIIAKRADLV